MRGNAEDIYVTGNTAMDAMKYTIHDNFDDAIIRWVEDRRMILLTAHRWENLDEPMRNVFRALKRIIQDNQDIFVV